MFLEDAVAKALAAAGFDVNISAVCNTDTETGVVYDVDLHGQLGTVQVMRKVQVSLDDAEELDMEGK